MEERKLVEELVKIGCDSAGNVYAYVIGRISAITRSEMHTAEEKVEEIQISLQCLSEALEEIGRRKNNDK